MIAHKTQFQTKVTLSSMDVKSMAVCDIGRMCLYTQSVLWDLDILQEAATIAYKDNDRCMAMGNILISNTLHYANGSNVT